MPGVVLHIRGTDFDPVAMLKSTRLTAYQSHNAGDTYTVGTNKGKPRPDGGLSLSVSNADGNLTAEIEDAILFLNKHRDPLQVMLSDPSVEDARLDFGYYLRIGGSCFGQCDYLPPELLRLAGDLNVGIELSLYPHPD